MRRESVAEQRGAQRVGVSRTTTLRLVLIAATIAVAFLARSAGPASADQVYHSERLELAPTGSQPGGGQVVNIHANGPVVGALERYFLLGGQPGETYEVWIQVCLGGGAYADFVQTATLTTDARGNGHSSGFFSAEDLAPLSEAVVDIRWVLRTNGIDQYATACTTVTID